MDHVISLTLGLPQEACYTLRSGSVIDLYWRMYARHLAPETYVPGKRNTQQIERKHLTLQTRSKRLTRKTICFSKSIELHDIVIGLFVNRYELDYLSGA